MASTAKQYDFFIIGTGPAGQTVATAAAKAGKSVGIVDYRPYGGTCPLRGCDPKKVLLAAARAMNAVDRLKGKGFAARPPFSWGDLQAWKEEFTEKVPPGTLKKLKKQGIDCLHGKAKFVAPHEIEVNGTKIRAEQVVIATGAQPRPLSFPGAELLLTSDQFLDMAELPASLVIIGGGYIGSEFAHIATVLGCQVTVIAMEDTLVSKFDRDLTPLLADAARERGMTLHFGSKATKVEKIKDGLRITAEREDGETFTVEAAAGLHAAGRVANVEGLELAAAGIAGGKRGIAVSNQLCTSVRAHYAIGDCTDSGLRLTPIASYEARLLVDNLLHKKNRQIDYLPIPTLAFTIPPIASVGMTAAEADESTRKLKINHEVTTHWFGTRHRNSIVSAYKVIIDEATDTILGAHLLGPGADETINLFALAIRQKITTGQLRTQVWAYPTEGGSIGSMVG